MENSVFDILIYVFDHYMFEELPANTERESIARDLESAGFGGANVERALDWLADLAEERERPVVAEAETAQGFRIFSAEELTHLSAECRGLLISLEHNGILNARQREIVIDRLMALDALDLDVEKVKWVALMVLSSQPGQEAAYARMEDLVFDLPEGVAH
jgi:Smg protein